MRCCERVQYAASSAADVVAGFYVYYRPYGSGPPAVEYQRRTVPSAGSRSSHYLTLGGLVPDSAYSLRMAAYNRFGVSRFSNTAVQKTLGNFTFRPISAINALAV